MHHLCVHLWLRTNARLKRSSLGQPCDLCGDPCDVLKKSSHLARQHLDVVLGDLLPVIPEELLPSEGEVKRLKRLARWTLEEKWCCICEQEMSDEVHMKAHHLEKWKAEQKR